MRTTYVKESAPAWLLIDADGETLGRLASRVAHVLRGKHKAAFAHHQMLGDHIVIVNASKLAFTPNKFRRKEYISHTGRPGGLSRTPLEKLFAENPEDVIIRAVRGMLPYNRQKPKLLKHLHVFRDDKHPYEAQKPAPITITK